MAITAADIKFRRSVNVGPGLSTAQGDPNDSIGGFASSTELTSAALHDLFDLITGDENLASDIEYRGMFAHQDHATLTLENAKAWLSSEVAGGASAAIALDGTGVVAENAAAAQMERIANESTAPGGEAFSAPTTKATGLSIGNMAANTVQGVWIRRSAANTAAVDNDGVTIRVEGDTAA